MSDLSVAQLIGLPSFINYCFHTNESDERYWQEWLVNHPEDAAVIKEAAEIVKAAGWLMQAENEKPAALVKMDEWLLSASRKRRPLLRYISVAAAAVLLLLVGIWYFRPTPVKPANPVAAIKSPRLYYSTVGSSRQGFLLPDSSYVLLESGSTLRLDSAYNGSSRNAQLNGTAYFKIRRDPTRPFEVKGNAYYVTVLGTAFRMTATGGNLEVWLESGKVKVEKEEKGQRSLLGYLLPSESLTIQPAAAAKPKTGAFAQASLNAWKAQELVFDNTPLPEVILQLEACYNIHIRIAGSTLQHEVFSGRFKNDALPAVLDVLCFTLNKQYEFTDSTNVLIK